MNLTDMLMHTSYVVLLHNILPKNDMHAREGEKKKRKENEALKDNLRKVLEGTYLP